MEHKSVALGCLLLVVLVGSCSADDVSQLLNEGQGMTSQIGAMVQDSGSGGQPECLTKLMPCKDYLKSTSPPATCCVPLKTMIATDGQCLCSIVNNDALMKQFNTTKEEAIAMAKACGANPDMSICKAAGGSPTNSPTPPAANNTGGGSSANNSTKSGAADLLSPSASFGLVVSSMAAMLFAFY